MRRGQLNLCWAVVDALISRAGPNQGPDEASDILDLLGASVGLGRILDRDAGCQPVISTVVADFPIVKNGAQRRFAAQVVGRLVHVVNCGSRLLANPFSVTFECAESAVE